MKVYSCVPEWDAMLTCIYDAWSSGIGHQNLRLTLEPIRQYSLFEENIHVDADPIKAEKVMNAVCNKISPAFYEELAYSAMAYEEDVLDNIYRMMLLGFHFGESALSMVQYRDVFRHQDILRRVSREAHHFQEFLRFHCIGKAIFVAHIEPKSRIVLALGPPFEDRMPSEHWMIIDDVHKEAVIHHKDEPFFFQKLSQEEFDKLLQTEEVHDEYTKLWQTFFKSIAIAERENPDCQNNLFPLWMRKHAVEFV